MAPSIREVMTPNPTVYPATTSIADAARVMRDTDIGDVLVERDGALCGIVTDRDIVVRAVAEDRNPAEVRLGDIRSRDLATLAPDDSVEDAIRLRRDKSLRRSPTSVQRLPTHDRHAQDGHPNWTARSARTARP